MNVFLTEEFISEVKAISKINSHSDCETDLISSIFTKNIDEISKEGTVRLGGAPDKSPFLRKRIGSEKKGKSSGYRLYFWLFVLEENVFLLYIHPKTGRRSSANISSNKRKELVSTFKTNRENNQFLEVELNKNRDAIIFLHNNKKVFK